MFKKFLLSFFVVLQTCTLNQTDVMKALKTKTLLIGNDAEIETTDPHIATGVPENRVITSLIEGLVSPNPKDLSPEPGVAERWEISKDLKTYTFYLNKNAKWSNGEVIVSSDFVFSFKRMLTPKLGADYAYMLYVIKNAEKYNKKAITDFSKVGVKEIDPHTLKITLDNPTPYFFSLLMHYSLFPVHRKSQTC